MSNRISKEAKVLALLYARHSLEKGHYDTRLTREAISFCYREAERMGYDLDKMPDNAGAVLGILNQPKGAK